LLLVVMRSISLFTFDDSSSSIILIQTIFLALVVRLLFSLIPFDPARPPMALADAQRQPARRGACHETHLPAYDTRAGGISRRIYTRRKAIERAAEI
jgi:hypothetical protein